MAAASLRTLTASSARAADEAKRANATARTAQTRPQMLRASKLAARENATKPLRGRQPAPSRHHKSQIPPPAGTTTYRALRQIRDRSARRVYRRLSRPCGPRALEYSRLLSKGQHNFADVVSRLHVGMGGACLVQGEGGIDDRPYLRGRN